MLPLGIGHKSLIFHNAGLTQAVTNNSLIGLQNNRENIQNVLKNGHIFSDAVSHTYCRKPATFAHLRKAVELAYTLVNVCRSLS